MALRPLRRAFATAQGAGRHIGVGSSLLDDGVHFVHAHPWFVDGRSNDEVANSVTTRALFGGRRVALFGLPAPFTGTDTIHKIETRFVLFVCICLCMGKL